MQNVDSHAGKTWIIITLHAVIKDEMRGASVNILCGMKLKQLWILNSEYSLYYSDQGDKHVFMICVKASI